MTPDLSKLQAGDTVHFRCGGSAVVTKYLSGRRYRRWQRGEITDPEIEMEQRYEYSN